MKQLFVTTCLFLLSVIPVSAASIGVSPKAIELRLDGQGSLQTMVRVFNTGQKTTVFELYPDDYQDQIELLPNRLTLEPEQSANVQVTFDDLDSGQYSTYLSIVGQEEGNDQALPKTGVKIPVEISIERVISVQQVLLLLSALLVIVALLALGIHLRQRDNMWYRFKSRLIRLLPPQHIRHHQLRMLKQYRLIIVSVIAIILSGVLLFMSFTIGQPNTVNQSYTDPTSTEPITSQIDLSSKQLITQLEANAENRYTAFTALEAHAIEQVLELDYDLTPDGVFIKQIGLNINGDQGRYWFYTVNEEFPLVASDKYILKSGDILRWEFRRPKD